MLLKKKKEKQAINEIKRLFSLAKDTPEKADRYVELARKTAMRHQISLPNEFKRSFCKKCGSYFIPSNCRTRIHESRLIQTCLKCKNIQRLPLN